jgi:hypothetical protein
LKISLQTAQNYPNSPPHTFMRITYRLSMLLQNIPNHTIISEINKCWGKKSTVHTRHFSSTAESWESKNNYRLGLRKNTGDYCDITVTFNGQVANVCIQVHRSYDVASNHKGQKFVRHTRRGNGTLNISDRPRYRP